MGLSPPYASAFSSIASGEPLVKKIRVFTKLLPSTRSLFTVFLHPPILCSVQLPPFAQEDES
jgi:hypothetical protein